jgi:hypothetical protein
MEMSYRLWRAVAAIMLLSTGGALAQTAGVTRAKVEAANAAWRKLSQSEVDCVDKALRARNSQIWMLIERGVGPGDASVAATRTGCRGQAKPPTPSAVVQNSSAPRAPEPPATSSNALQAAIQANAIGSRMPSGYWSFNGSTLNMVAEGNLRKFFYAQLDPEAEAAGAQRGDLFLEGKVSDQRIVGTVYGHEGRCGRIPYRVDGTIRDSNRRLELQGQKPRVDGTCTVVGTVLDALTFKSVDTATAVAAAAPVAKPDITRPDVTKAEVTKPEVTKPEVTKPVAVRPAIERAADVMAAADQAAIEKADADDAAEFRTAPDKRPADRPAASRTTPVKVVLAAASESKVAGNQAVAEKASAETAVQIARVEAARAQAQAQAQAEQARSEAERAVAEAITMVASAQSKISFLYGLLSGPAVLGMGALVFWLMRRRRQALPEPSAA